MTFHDDLIHRRGLPWDVRELLHDICYHHDGRPCEFRLCYVKRAQDVLKSKKTPPKPIRWMECDNCDGCGWTEGGRTLKTTCRTCHGKGKVRA